jgi:dTDP-4-amino-4,6-dideoxygalactose transaminase
MGAILNIAARQQLKVIEHNAQAQITRYRGRCVGSLDRAAAQRY